MSWKVRVMVVTRVFLTSIGLQCQANGVGWQGGQKYCGESGFWIQECTPEILLFALHSVLLQEISLNVWNVVVCLPDMDYTDQGCR